MPIHPTHADVGDGLAPRPRKTTMQAVVTTGHGGTEQLLLCERRIPTLVAGEVLLQVLAAGVNNTDINTRVGWYADGFGAPSTGEAPAGWKSATPFPLIQGADCCGRVVAVAPGVDPALVGQRVLVRSCMRVAGFASMETAWLGSDIDGAFAQYLKVPAGEVFAVRSDLSDAELGAIPCAYGSAENMLTRAALRAGEQVLVTGASGGVGLAVVQLAKLRGARVIAIAGPAKTDPVRAAGADQVLARDADLLGVLGQESVDLVVDPVAGPGFGALLKLLRRGARYVSCGAIGGPQVAMDMRDFYLKDLRLIGCTAWEEPVFPRLVAAIERGAIRPMVARSFALDQIADAQREFVRKQHVGKLVLIPPAV